MSSSSHLILNRSSHACILADLRLSAAQGAAAFGQEPVFAALQGEVVQDLGPHTADEAVCRADLDTKLAETWPCITGGGFVFRPIQELGVVDVQFGHAASQLAARGPWCILAEVR